MEYIAVIDLSSFIWDQTDFDTNKNNYYMLMQSLPNLYTKIEENKTQVLLRTELYNQILSNFPYSNIPHENYDFLVLTLNFLTGLGSRADDYSDSDIKSISSNPDISRQYYNYTLKTEIRYLISRLHSIRTPLSKYFTFDYLWNSKENLKTTNSIGPDSYEIETIRYDNQVKLDAFFQKYRRVFEHNPKHNQFKTGSSISPLSCYNERIGNKDQAQLLLDDAEQFSDLFYNFDTLNDVYVIFRNTNNNIYHGYNEQNENNIPVEIRRKFNK
jgi:hypothetical protein